MHLLIDLGPEAGGICNIIPVVSLLFSGFFVSLMADWIEFYYLVLHSLLGLELDGFFFCFFFFFLSWLYSFSFVLDCARFLILRALL